MKYGEEYADSDNPAQEIAWSLANVLYDELYLNGIDLNPSEFDLEQRNIDTEISEFGEELDVCAICCQPTKISSGEFWGGAWIRVAWSSKTQELRNVFIMSNVKEYNNDEVIEFVFQNVPLVGIADAYNALEATDLVEFSQYSIHMKENIISSSDSINGIATIYNMEFLPHSVYVEKNELYFSNGKRVSIDTDWFFNPTG